MIVKLWLGVLLLVTLLAVLLFAHIMDEQTSIILAVGS